MKKKLIKGTLFSCGLIFCSLAWAQEPLGYYKDAVRFSRTTFGGTARYQGLAGAGTALGADLTATALNPAGLGLYRKSEFTFSTGLGFSGAHADYLETTNKANKAYLFFPNFGVSFTGEQDDLDERAWKGGTFAVTYNRINNFQDKVSLYGNSEESSMLYKFWEIVENSGYTSADLDNIPEGQFEDLPTLIYWSWLVQERYDNVFYPDEYFYPPDHNSDFVTFNPVPVRQEYTVTSKGGQNMWNVSYGGNFDNRFYIGASLGIASLRYNTENVYQEKALEEDSDVAAFSYTESFNTKGTGVNFRLGMIYKITDFLRAGLSLQTPTYYGVTENYRYGIIAKYNDFVVPNSGFTLDQENVKTIPGYFKYNMTTPARVNGGIAWFSEKRGFISADIELVPYNTATLANKDDNFLFSEDNRYISNNLNTAININIGGEFRSGPFMARGGFARLADAYGTNVDDIDRAVYTVTAGAGVRYPEYYFDFAVVNSRSKGVLMPYTLSDGSGPVGNLKNRATSAIVTFGTFF